MEQRGGRSRLQEPLTFAAFDVVVVPFPYSDRLAEKRRPALIVSATRLEQELGRVWVAMITSDRATRQRGDAVIGDLAAAGLPAASIMRGNKLATIDADRVIRRAGSLAQTDREASIAALRSCSAF